MIAVVQRVGQAAVHVAGAEVAAIRRGFLVLLGVAQGDGEREADYLARRIAELRVFEDAAGRMNLALADVGGGVLAVSQFTLLAGLRRGRRPDFVAAAPPEDARRLFDHFVEELRRRGVDVQTGRFAATMEVSLLNSGPATFLLDSRSLLG